MNGTERGDAVYNALRAQGAFNGCNDAERDSVRKQLRFLWSADLSYIVANAQVNPSTLQNPAGQQVATAGGPTNQTGATTLPSTLIGLGTVS